MISLVMVAVGIVLLAISLAFHYDGGWPIAAFASWLGAILVVVGTGKMFFLDN